MKLSKWYLGLAAVMGLGSAAGAATMTIEEYGYRLRYEGTTLPSVRYYDGETGQTAEFGTIHSSADPFKLPHRFSNLRVGDYLDMRVQAHIPSVPVWDAFGNGGSAPLCFIGSYDCSSSVHAAETGLHLYSAWDIFEIKKVGNKIFHVESEYAGNWHSIEFGEIWYWDPQAEFTIVAELAPVPLPASAALLPVGIGAFAMIRRRRRKIS